MMKKESKTLWLFLSIFWPDKQDWYSKALVVFCQIKIQMTISLQKVSLNLSIHIFMLLSTLSIWVRLTESQKDLEKWLWLFLIINQKNWVNFLKIYWTNSWITWNQAISPIFLEDLQVFHLRFAVYLKVNHLSETDW